jgi:hypothetical protein
VTADAVERQEPRQGFFDLDILTPQQLGQEMSRGVMSVPQISKYSNTLYLTVSDKISQRLQ